MNMQRAKAVLASVKVRNLKANHSKAIDIILPMSAVLASVKVRNLKANHSADAGRNVVDAAVLASVKVRNLKANHSDAKPFLFGTHCCISKCEGTKSES